MDKNLSRSSMEATNPESQEKSKTKAKQRYLRRKKERRKRTKQHPSEASGLVQKVNGEESESEVESESLTDNETELRQEKSENQTSCPRPVKRRKVAEDIQESSTSEDDVDQMETEISPPHAVRSVTPPRPLPIFPLPALPNAPSKSALALQGLDKAFIDAEFVDPDTVLPIPTEDTKDGGTHLSGKMRRKLHEIGIAELFAVQTSLLPFLVPQSSIHRRLYLSTEPTRDVCVSAPTGSGKTLAYVLPIIEILSSRIVTQLRALIVLPTRDLVAQVRETFEVLGKGHGLKIGTATGQHSFAHEQSQLVNDLSPPLLGGSSKIDILICTPGRLIDHLNGTPNFTLQHLRFLVIDEADRLLAQSFQDWLVQVLAATRTSTVNKSNLASDLCPRSDPVAPNLLSQLPYTHVPTFLTDKHESSCQKLLFSATLTRDPGKIAALELRDPKYFVVQKTKDDVEEHVLDVVMGKFSMPSSLAENMIVCDSSQKPLMFFHLLLGQNVTDALVFTKSAESTARLVRLFEFYMKRRKTSSQQPPLTARAYSSDLAPGERKTILEKFKAKEINILICSDLISRGIDISHVSHVVSYDVPVDMRKYVHRVGRTARAGRTGSAWTLVEEQEARYFKNMLKDAGHLERVKRLRVADKDLELLTPDYEMALKQLKEAYTRS